MSEQNVKYDYSDIPGLEKPVQYDYSDIPGLEKAQPQLGLQPEVPVEKGFLTRQTPQRGFGPAGLTGTLEQTKKIADFPQYELDRLITGKVKELREGLTDEGEVETLSMYALIRGKRQLNPNYTDMTTIQLKERLSKIQIEHKRISAMPLSERKRLNIWPTDKEERPLENEISTRFWLQKSLKKDTKFNRAFEQYFPYLETAATIAAIVYGGYQGITSVKTLYQMARIGKVVHQLNPQDKQRLYDAVQRGQIPKWMKKMPGAERAKILRTGKRETIEVKPFFRKLENLFRKTKITEPKVDIPPRALIPEKATTIETYRAEIKEASKIANEVERASKIAGIRSKITQRKTDLHTKIVNALSSRIKAKVEKGAKLSKADLDVIRKSPEGAEALRRELTELAEISELERVEKLPVRVPTAEPSPEIDNLLKAFPAEFFEGKMPTRLLKAERKELGPRVTRLPAGLPREKVKPTVKRVEKRKPIKAEFFGFQPDYNKDLTKIIAQVPMYNLLEDIPGHPKGSSISDITIREAGFEPPPIPKEAKPTITRVREKPKEPKGERESFEDYLKRTEAPTEIEKEKKLVNYLLLVKRHGGLSSKGDLGGEVRRLPLYARNNKGLTLDAMWEKLKEEGYDLPTVNDLVEKLLGKAEVEARPGEEKGFVEKLPPAAQAELDAWEKHKTKEMPAGEIAKEGVGTTFKILGEEYEVKQDKPGMIVIRDGETYKVDEFEKIPVDEGSLKGPKKAKLTADEYKNIVTENIDERGNLKRGGDYFSGQLEKVSTRDLDRLKLWSQAHKSQMVSRFITQYISAEQRSRVKPPPTVKVPGAKHEQIVSPELLGQAKAPKGKIKPKVSRIKRIEGEEGVGLFKREPPKTGELFAKPKVIRISKLPTKTIQLKDLKVGDRYIDAKNNEVFSVTDKRIKVDFTDKGGAQRTGIKVGDTKTGIKVKIGDNIYSVPNDKIRKQTPQVVTQDGKKRIFDIDKDIEIRGDVNAPETTFAGGQMHGMASNSQKAQAHIIKKKLSLSDEGYEKLAVSKTGKKSMTNMTMEEAKVFIDALNKLKVVKVVKKPEQLSMVRRAIIPSEVPTKALSGFKNFINLKKIKTKKVPFAQMDIAGIVRGDKVYAAIRRSGFYARKEIQTSPVRNIYKQTMAPYHMALMQDGYRRGGKFGAIFRNVWLPTEEAIKNEKEFVALQAESIRNLAKKHKIKATKRNLRHLSDVMEGKVEATPQEELFTKSLRLHLDDLRKQANYVRDMMGKDQIGYIEDYVPHLQKTSLWNQLLTNEATISDNLDFIIPNQVKNPFSFKRMMEEMPKAERNLFTLLDRYVKAIAKDIYITPAIENIKAYNRVLKNRELINASKYWDEYIRTGLIGKQHKLDTALSIGFKGRKALQKWNHMVNLAFLTGKAAWNVATQPLSYMMNVPMETGIRNSIKGIFKSFLNRPLRKFVKENSKVLNIKGSDVHSIAVGEGRNIQNRIYRTKIDKYNHFISMLSAIEERELTLASYIAGLGKAKNLGYTGKDALTFADLTAARTQSMYNKENRALILNSDIARTLFPFQSFSVEMFNHLKEITTKAKGAESLNYRQRFGKLFGLLVGLYLASLYSKALTGRRKTTPGTFIPFAGNYVDALTAKVQNKEYYGGRSPITVIQISEDIIRGAKDFIKYGSLRRLRKIGINFGLALGGIGGGGQINNIIDGVVADIEEDVKNVKGDVMFRVEDAESKVKAPIFGVWATKEGIEYWQPKEEKQPTFKRPTVKKVKVR